MSQGAGAPTRLLALCSATRTASVALVEQGRVTLEHGLAVSRHQSESLLPLVDRVLRERNLQVSDLDGFGIAIGPGSFTSLRIGVATLKGLAYGSPVPVAAISTLQIMAAALGSGTGYQGPVVAMLDAQRGQVYAAAFRNSEADSPRGWEPLPDLLSESVYDASGLAAVLPGKCVLVGEGVQVVGAQLQERLGAGVKIANPRGEPAAGRLGILALRILQREEGVEVADLVPRYVRRAEAEVSRTAQRLEKPA